MRQTIANEDAARIRCVRQVRLELVQPVGGPSMYRDWLDEHGEGSIT